MLPIPLVLVLSLLLALVCSAIPWLARPLGDWSLAIGLVVGIVVGLIDVVHPFPPYPWADLVALVVAWSGGLLLGRRMAPHFRPVLLVFLCLSALDVLLTAGLSLSPPQTAAGSTPLRFGDFLLLLPWGRFETNVVDLLLLTALAEHWRRRDASYVIAFLPGALGFLLVAGFLLVTKVGILPGIPFFTAGYVLTEVVYRYTDTSRRRASSPAKLAR
jgi:xanthosine utilization system XapX-like protein